MTERPAASSNPAGGALFAFVLLVIVGGIAFSPLVPPAVAPADTGASDFSAARAFEYLKVIARAPHPTGSAANARVRDYLIQELRQLGVEAQVQRTSIASLLDIFSTPYAAGTVENVVARLRGTASTGAVLLMAHYDSVATAPGATDNGSGVATLLETLRALKHSPPLRNDVIFLFTDGEELGEVGSQGFVSEHLWAKEVSAVWNLDSGGSCGAAGIEFGNEAALQRLRRVTPRPLASSVGDELAKLAPLGGDDTLVFDPAKVQIAKAGYSGCYYRYHTAKDNLESIDLRSVQHLGLYTLAVVREWGNSNLIETATLRRSVYFVILRRIVSYPAAISQPFSILLVLLYAVVVWLGVNRTGLTLGGMGRGVLLWLASALVCAALTGSLWWILKALNLVNFSYSSAYNAGSYALAFLILSIAVTSGLYLLFRRKTSSESLAMGGLFWCLILAVLSSWFAPGTSFLFIWPLGFVLVSLGVASLGCPRIFIAVLRLLCAVPAILIFTPLIAYTTLNLSGDPGSSFVASNVLSIVCLAFLAPQLELIGTLGGLRISLGMALAGVGLLTWGAFNSGYDNWHPRPDTIAYWLNADTGKASWISLDEKPDGWTSQFLTEPIESDKLSILATPGGDKVLKANAPPLPLPAPQISLLNDSITTSKRTLHLHLTSARQPITLWVSVKNATILHATIDGKEMPAKTADKHDKLWGFYYAAPPRQGIELAISFNSSEKPQITLTDQSSDLPSIPGFQRRARASEIMPLNYFPAFDSTTFVSKTLTVLDPR